MQLGMSELMRSQLGALGYLQCDDGSSPDLYGDCADGTSPYSINDTPTLPNATYACLYGGTYPNCIPAPSPASTTMPTQASTTAGLTALQQLTNAASSRLSALPGQTSLQPGQSLVMGPNGQYEIVSSGSSVAGLSSLSSASLTSLLPWLLIGAVVLMAAEGGHR